MHPRKCEGYGLSDGEGCECLWSAIRKLIPSLCSAGVCKQAHLPIWSNKQLQYWSRLFALDSQLIWFEKQNLLELGNWVQRKMTNAFNCQLDAKLKLEQSGIPLATLECEWKAQIEAQLAAAPHE